MLFRHNSTMQLFGLALLLLCGLLLLRPRLKTSQRYGSATLVRRSHLFHRRHRGLVIDGCNRLSQKHSFQHLMCVSPTGTGKSQGYVLPNLLTLDSSIVVTDIKGELYDLTAAHLHRRQSPYRRNRQSSPPGHLRRDSPAINECAHSDRGCSFLFSSRGGYTEPAAGTLRFYSWRKPRRWQHYHHAAGKQSFLR
mgnify:CR=1 FL=1